MAVRDGQELTREYEQSRDVDRSLFDPGSCDLLVSTPPGLDPLDSNSLAAIDPQNSLLPGIKVLLVVPTVSNH